MLNEKPIDNVLSRLKNKKKTSTGYTAQCPVHDDNKNSLSVSEGNDGKVLLKCHTGCEFKDIVTALGMEVKELFPNLNRSNKSRISKVYNYTDENGNIVYQVCRQTPKGFTQRRPDGKDGWIWNLKGTKFLIYRLPQTLNAIANNRTIFIVEGEKDVESLEKLGLIATCNSGGAGKWKKHYNDHLKDARVVILPDNDDPGRKHAERIAENLYGIAQEIRILDLPSLPEKGDVSDWLRNGGTKEKLSELVKETPLWKPYLHSSSNTNKKNIQEFNLSDSGNAKRLVYYFGHLIRYNEVPFKKWFIWDGTRWKVDTTKMIYEYADKMVCKIYEDASNTESEEKRRELGKWAHSSETARRKRDMVFLASSEQSITIDINELDSNPWLFNVLNYTLHFKDDCLLDEPIPKNHEPNDYITKIAPVNYNPSATCPKWDKFLIDIFNGDEALITFVQRAVGYSLTGDISEQCLFFCYGTGKNGKSVFLETLRMLFGDYGGKAPSEMMMQQRYQTIPSDVARLKGKRLVITSEIEENRRLAEARIKDITGGDTITARRLYEDWFEFKPTHKLWIYGNYKPVIRGTDTGVWRRIKLIPFNVTISEDKQLPMSVLLDGFKKELSGILNWAIHGYIEFQGKGLPEPEAVQTATGTYRSEMDLIGQFITECCIIDSDKKIFAQELWSKYKEWCDKNGEHWLSSRKFINKLKERGFESTRGHANKVFLLGIQLQGY